MDTLPPRPNLETDARFILPCDKSGAKGYANQDEQYPGGVGLFAGLLGPDAILSQTEAALESAIAPHRGIDSKLHITAITAPAQAALRHGLFDAIRRCQLPCFWYAIHVAGFHAHHNRMVGLLDDAAEQVRTLERFPQPLNRRGFLRG